MELIKKKFQTNLLRSAITVPDLEILAGEKPSGILPSEVQVALKSMKKGTVPESDVITAGFLRIGGHMLHILLVTHITPYLLK